MALEKATENLTGLIGTTAVLGVVDTQLDKLDTRVDYGDVENPFRR